MGVAVYDELDRIVFEPELCTGFDNILFDVLSGCVGCCFFGFAVVSQALRQLEPP